MSVDHQYPGRFAGHPASDGRVAQFVRANGRGIRQVLCCISLSHNNGPTPYIVIDEYGTSAEEVPGGSAWWISRLERYNMYGLRGNWASGAQLHDFLAGLLGKTDVTSTTGTGYYANGGKALFSSTVLASFSLFSQLDCFCSDWNVYQYYATQMTGYRVATTGSTDRLMDCYAVVGSGIVRILVGGRQIIGELIS